MGEIYNFLFYRPLLNTLVFFYNTIAVGDLGLSIIYLTIFIRLILYPLFKKSMRYQLVMQKIQPQVKKIQETHKDSRQKQGEALMELYREHRVNPFSGIFILIVQLPVLIALYRIFLQGLRPEIFSGLYSFVAAPSELHSTFLGLINLAEKNILVAGFAGLAQYFQSRMILKRTPGGNSEKMGVAEQIGRQMVVVGPAISVVILVNLPAAVALYWLISSLISWLQQNLVNKNIQNDGKLGDVRKKNN